MKCDSELQFEIGYWDNKKDTYITCNTNSLLTAIRGLIIRAGKMPHTRIDLIDRENDKDKLVMAYNPDDETGIWYISKHYVVGYDKNHKIVTLEHEWYQNYIKKLKGLQ